ncbi:GlcG/HbpS family heme-binding protein [Veillonella criceti]|uniref:Uncharacterized conserved protein n=1 Tax=Veillonella criceti TaxID=103891 RepID=A0A380NLU5_9FIRM|nr:heme-binding protein [Veillonella criceti]SUP44265.1 Uncharacterized conserved protein [Veillonella criceti]
MSEVSELTSELSSAAEATVLRKMAKLLLEGAEHKAEELGVPMVISIVDAHGNPVLLYRMVNALLVSTDIAAGKAYTAVAFKCKTAVLHDKVQPGANLFQVESMVSRRLVTFAGGYPLKLGKQIIGGLGVSGGTVDQDTAVAEAALAYMEAQCLNS